MLAVLPFENLSGDPGIIWPMGSGRKWSLRSTRSTRNVSASLRTGRDEDARRILTALEAAAQQQYVPPYAFALIYAGLAQPDAMFPWLQRAHAARDVHLMFLTVDPKWDPYRTDSRFIELLSRCGFTRGARPLPTERPQAAEERSLK